MEVRVRLTVSTMRVAGRSSTPPGRGVRNEARQWAHRVADASAGGQGVVEFALLFPLFMALFFGLIEFALAFNATLTINHASEEAARTASVAGNMAGADCLILQGIEQDVTTPNDRR